MPQSRILVLANPLTQTLPNGKQITHPQFTHLTFVAGPKTNAHERTVMVFEISPEYPHIELHANEFCGPPSILRITKDFGPYQIWDTFDADFHKPHQQGFVYATDRYKGHEAVELPLNICEAARQHTADVGACAV